MKVKIFFLTCLAWLVPLLGMEEQQNVVVPAQIVINDPRFLSTKAKFEAVDAKVEISGNSIWIDHDVWHPYGCSISRLPNCVDTFEKVYVKLCRKIREDQIFLLKYRARYSLQGLSILKIAQECKKGNKQFLNGIAALPKDLRNTILMFAE